jgi:hypothetical protein
VTTFPSATLTVTPAGIATGSLPILDMPSSSLLRFSEGSSSQTLAFCFQ